MRYSSKIQVYVAIAILGFIPPPPPFGLFKKLYLNFKATKGGKDLERLGRAAFDALCFDESVLSELVRLLLLSPSTGHS